MDLKPIKLPNTQCNTNTSKQPTVSPQQAKQVSYTFTFKNLIEDLMMEQREQM